MFRMEKRVCSTGRAAIAAASGRKYRARRTPIVMLMVPW
jgi:hypothetical protein